MAKTRGAHFFTPQVRRSPTPLAVGPSLVAVGPTAAGFASAGPVASSYVVADPSATIAGACTSALAMRPTAAPAAGDVGDAEGSSIVALAQRRYHTRVGPTPPAP